MLFTPGDVYYPRFNKVYILARGAELLAPEGEAVRPVSEEELPPILQDLSNAHYIGDYQSQHCFVLQLTREELASLQGYGLHRLRELLGLISDTEFQMYGRALQITRWYRDHQYCGACGSLNREAERERAMICDKCELRSYPRISPCVICLVSKGEQMLLARHARHAQAFFTTLAGFVEPGESAEQAVHREVKEETGINIHKLRYFGSQAWPFPGQLMLGFVAEYESGDIVVDKDEILEAQWFGISDLPKVPPPSTISAQLIRSFIEQKGKVKL